LLQLLKDSLSTTYDNILALDTTNEFQVPEDFYSALNEAADKAGEQAIVELDAGIHLYLFELNRITKTGEGSTTPSSPWNGQGSKFPCHS
jgi:hypothetical protein